jgi:hypothetical protein
MARFSDMDAFGIESMGAEEHARKQSQVIESCKCPTCPTYVEGDSPIGYCFPLIGTSKKIQWEKDCVCGTCPVYKEYELDHTHYCTRCSQFCQRFKSEGAGGQE